MDLPIEVNGINDTVTSEQIHCLLLCIAYDIPAGCKVCGFLGHTAVLGCSRYTKKFTGSVGCMIYSGFDRHSWRARSVDEHCQDIASLLQCNKI